MSSESVTNGNDRLTKCCHFGSLRNNLMHFKISETRDRWAPPRASGVSLPHPFIILCRRSWIWHRPFQFPVPQCPHPSPRSEAGTPEAGTESAKHRTVSDTDAVFGKCVSLGKPPCRTAPSTSRALSQAPARPPSFNPTDDPAKDTLCFLPHFAQACAEVQGSGMSNSRSRKWRRQDLNPGRRGPAATPANASPPLGSCQECRDGAPRTPRPAALLGREVTHPTLAHRDQLTVSFRVAWTHSQLSGRLLLNSVSQASFQSPR